MGRGALIQFRRGESLAWEAYNTLLADGEVGYSRDANEIRVGNGVDPWDDLDPLISKATSDAAIETATAPVKLATQRASLSGRLGRPGVDLGVLTTDPPTVTNGSAATINGRVENANSTNITTLGRKGAWVSGATDVDGAFTGREFYADGDVEFSWKARGTNSARFLILIDGLATTAAPFQPSGTTTAGATYYQKLVFGVAKRRKITIYASRISAWGAFRFSVTTTVQASPPRPLISVVGASFDAGWTTVNNTSALQAVGFTLSRLLGVDVQVAAQESTGFLAPGGTEVYSAPARIARVVERMPELIVLTASGNDLGLLTLPEFAVAVLTTLDALALAAPGVPIIVFGIPIRDAVATLTADIAARNNIVRQISLAHDSVIAFHDMLGIPSDTVPAAYSSVKTDYAAGDLVTYKGSVWRLSPHIVGSTPANAVPGTSERWRLETWLYTGTGKVGTVVGDGTRDVLLSSDGTHPEVAGLLGIAQLVESAVRANLSA